MSISFWPARACCATAPARLLALSGRMSVELFVRSVERAHRYRITSLATLEQIARLQFQAGVDALPARPSTSPSATARPIKKAP